MLPPGDSYESIRAAFRWRVPERYNMGVDCCDKWADGSGRPALLHLRESGGGLERITFDALKAHSNRLANTLRAHGVGRGDRVAVLLPQVPETAVAHIAAFKLGPGSVPLFPLFRGQALEFRPRDCSPAARGIGATGLCKTPRIRARTPGSCA